MANPEKKSMTAPLLVVIGLAALIGIGYLTKDGHKAVPQANNAEQVIGETLHETPPPVTEETSSNSTESEAQMPTSASATQETLPDIVNLTTPRILGNPNAPVRIAEHSSFTCGACAAYHKTNFKQIKTDYIDTGKAYLVFDDFPRNAVDIDVGSLARCIDGDDAYFNFIQLMFETQEQWAKGDYKEHVKQNAMIAGLSAEKVDLCMNNEEIHKALADHREATQEKFSVTGTPTLVIAERQSVSGLAPYDQIKKAIEDALATTGSSTTTAPQQPEVPAENTNPIDETATP